MNKHLLYLFLLLVTGCGTYDRFSKVKPKVVYTHEIEVCFTLEDGTKFYQKRLIREGYDPRNFPLHVRYSDYIPIEGIRVHPRFIGKIEILNVKEIHNTDSNLN